MCCVPPCAPPDVILSMQNNHNKLIEHGVEPCYVFDGCKHPMKVSAHDERANKRLEARNALDLFYQRGRDDAVILTDDDHSLAMKDMKALVSPASEILSMVANWMHNNSAKHMCAPFEAEWQCACLEQCNIVDSAMSTDGDCVILGVRKLYYNVNFNSCAFQVYDKEIDIIDKIKNPLFAQNESKWAMIGCLLGCDCINRIENVGYSTLFKKILPSLVTWDAMEIMNACNAKLKYKMTEAHKNKLVLAVNLSHFAPVLDCDYELQPLNGEVDKSNWGSIIGFVQNPQDILPVQRTSYFKAQIYDGCSFCMNNGEELRQYDALAYGNRHRNVHKDTPAPLFSIINFDAIPMRCCASFMFQCYAAAHLGYEDSINREDLIQIATRMHELNKTILEPEKVPMQIDAWSLQGVMLPARNSNWDHNGYYILMKRNLCPITDDLISSIYPVGNENNRKRAMQLLKSGAMQYSTMQHINCCSRLDNNLTMILLKIEVTPSMKSKVKNSTSNNQDQLEDHCTVHLAFNADAKNMLHYPCTICGCYDGRHICSHITGFLLFIRCAQRCDFNKDMFEKSLPASPIALQNKLTLIENIVCTEALKNAKRKRAHELSVLSCKEEM